MSEDKIKTGIIGLDERLGGGLPKGSIVLIVSDSETCLRMFSQQVPFNMASIGLKVIYFSIVKEPQFVREEMDLYKWDTVPLEEKGAWVFVDAYTPKIDTLLLHSVVTPDSTPLALIRSEMLSKLKKGEVVVIDSLSDLLVTQKPDSVIELLEIISAKIMKIGGLALIPVLKNMHDKKTIATISHLADVVLEFIVGEARFEGRLVFWKMRRVRLEPLFLPFSITDRGIVAETFRRVI